MDWKAELQSQVDQRTEHFRSEDNDSAYSFIGDRQLRDAWNYFFRGTHVDPVITDLRHHILDDVATSSVIKIASILIRIEWAEWEDFASIFINGHEGRRDKNLPFSMHDLSRVDFLGQRYAQLFFDVQAIYSPVIIEEDQDQEYQPTQFHLPFTFESKRLSKGSFGIVTKVKVARGYLKRRDGTFNDDGEKEEDCPLARKQLPYPTDWEAEVRRLRTIRDIARQHSHLMSHIGTVVIGESFNVLCDWMDEDLHTLLHERDVGENVCRAQHLLAEVSDLADAVNFLHSQRDSGLERLTCSYIDLRPKNITRKPQFYGDPIGRWMIRDFKICALLDIVPDPSSTVWKYGGVVQAPELDEAQENWGAVLNGKADSWALGCILCMVFGFAVGGKESVQALGDARTYGSIGNQKHDVFYDLVQVGNKRLANPKGSVNRWLAEVQESNKRAKWIAECARLISDILRIDQTERPTAESIQDALENLSILSLEPSSSPNEDIPVVIPSAGDFDLPPITESFQNDAYAAGPTTDSLATRMGRTSLTSDPFRPSREGSVHLRIHEGSRRHTLAEVKELGRVRPAHHIALCPTGTRIIVCLKDQSIVYERRHDHSESAYSSVRVLRACEWGHISGLFYVLQGARNEGKLKWSEYMENIVAGSTETGDSFFTKLTQSSMIRGSDVSTKGLVALMSSQSMRLEFAKRAIGESERRGPPERYHLRDSKGYRQEKFYAVAFSADGDRLVACSEKHWFLWDLSTINQRPFDVPVVGNLGSRPAHSYYSNKNIIHMTKRAAFFLYEPRLCKVWLYDCASKTVTEDDCEMVCGIVTPHDSHLLYVKIETMQALQRRYVLMRQAINLDNRNRTSGLILGRASTERNRTSSLVLGKASKECNLDSLRFRPGAVLKLAFLQSGSECDLVIASSTGDVVEARLMYED